MMQGWRHGRPPHGKARAMACGGNPRALPDFGVVFAPEKRSAARAPSRIEVSLYRHGLRPGPRQQGRIRGDARAADPHRHKPWSRVFGVKKLT